LSVESENSTENIEMNQANKNSFFFYVLKEGGGKIDPRNIEFMIEALKEWLPNTIGYPDTDYSMNAYKLGQREYKEFIMRNLK
jgi:hypothetical protein